MRPEDWHLGSGQQQAQLKKEVVVQYESKGARIEELVEMVPRSRQVVVLELSPEEAQTIYAVSNWHTEVVKLLEEKRASSEVRKIQPGSVEHLRSLFNRLRPVVSALFPGKIS